MSTVVVFLKKSLVDLIEQNISSFKKKFVTTMVSSTKWYFCIIFVPSVLLRVSIGVVLWTLDTYTKEYTVTF